MRIFFHKIRKLLVSPLDTSDEEARPRAVDILPKYSSTL